MLGDPVGEPEIGELRLARCAPGDDLERHVVHDGRVAALDQQAAGEGAHGLAGGSGIGQAAGQKEPQVLLGRDDGRRLGRGVRGDDHLGEDLDDPAGRLGIQRPVQRDDAAEGRGRVAAQRPLVGLHQARALGDAARVGVLDDRHRGRTRRVELGDAFVGRIRVVEVVVRKLLALELAGRGDAGARLAGSPVEGGALVRVLAVAQPLREGAAEGAEQGRLVGTEAARHPVGDRRVVGGGAGERLLRQAAPQLRPGGTVIGFERGQHGRIV